MFTYFNNNSIRNLVVAFGSLFNNIYVRRYESNGDVKEQMRIPLAYGNKEKYLRRLDEGGSITNEDGAVVQMTLPRMSFEIESIEYDTTRKRNTMQRLSNYSETTDTDDKTEASYSEVPYNINFNLYIMSKFMNDGLQIIEQILPYFTPEFTVTINPGTLATKMDIPLVLNNINNEEEWEGDFDSRRSLTWTLGFSAKTYIYGRKSESRRIKRIMATLFDGGVDTGTTGAATFMSDVGITGPGGTASGPSVAIPDVTIRMWGGESGDIDIYGDIISE
jgi:hypothetical protein